MKKILFIFIVFKLITLGCTTKNQTAVNEHADETFSKLESSFLDAYWKEYPSGSIFNGYGQYYDRLIIPDSICYIQRIIFSKQWIDSLNKLNFNALENNNKISFNIIKNQLNSDIWYTSILKPQEWDATNFNLAGECDYIINQPYAPLDERLKILSKHLEHADDYFKAAIVILRNPTKEHLDLSILQNQGGLSVFGASLTDSITSSSLTASEKEALQQNINKTTKAIHEFVTALKAIAADKNHVFRDFRIGKELYDEKFKYDLAIDITPEQLFEKAKADKLMYTQQMYTTANALWPRYNSTIPKPKDSLQMIQKVLDKIQLQHATPLGFFDSLTKQVYQLKKFIVEKNLFDFDTASPPVKVRIMPEYARGFTIASAEFTPPYQKSGTTYYNIDDLTLFPPEKAESALREINNYSSQLLSIHEAIPGHCLQGIYNNKKSPDVIRSVFQNGAMIEGWAVYTEGMMLDNGWGSHSPEMDLVHGKLKLRELANVIIDYELQCLNASKENLINLMVKECFQTNAQAEEKYHRATVSQVQLCSYYAGATAIQSLRDDYQKKMGNSYQLKEFHEKFLSYGSSPVKYIREEMMK
ncbi:MAG: DUF885 domain-containing protein [Saprospiraceae bacterium]